MVTVTHVDLVPGSTIAIGHGTDEQGRRVAFGGDWRMLREMAFAIAAGEVVEAEIPSWSFLGFES